MELPAGDTAVWFAVHCFTCDHPGDHPADANRLNILTALLALSVLIILRPRRPRATSATSA